MVANTRELLPEPDTPVNTVSRRLGSSTLTSLRLFSRAPCTRIRSWVSATCSPLVSGSVFVAVLVSVLIGSPSVGLQYVLRGGGRARSLPLVPLVPILAAQGCWLMRTVLPAGSRKAQSRIP